MINGYVVTIESRITNMLNTELFDDVTTSKTQICYVY